MNSYVDLLLGEFKHYKTRLAHAGIDKEVIFCGKVINCTDFLFCYSSGIRLTINFSSSFRFSKSLIIPPGPCISIYHLCVNSTLMAVSGGMLTLGILVSY